MKHKQSNFATISSFIEVQDLFFFPSGLLFHAKAGPHRIEYVACSITFINNEKYLDKDY